MFGSEEKRERRKERRRELVSACAVQLGWPEERVDGLLPEDHDRFYDSLDVADFVAELAEEFKDDSS